MSHIIGVAVNEMTIEIRMDTDRVTANSRNRRPSIPPIRRMGKKTAISEREIEMTVKLTSPAPLITAFRSGMPPSR